MTAGLSSRTIRRAVLPATTFALVWVVHYIWLGLSPETRAVQSRWVSLDGLTEASWWTRYLDSRSYYIGFSYALALAFAAVALRRYRERRLCGARNLAVGGITLSGFFAIAGCYLLGCCGSPMLAVYMSLFGAAFLPFAKPLVAALTVVFISVAWWRLNRTSPYSRLWRDSS